MGDGAVTSKLRAAQEDARELIRDSIVEDAISRFIAQILEVAAKDRADRLAATLARAERAEAELAKLADPNAVHVSMLAGTVAKPSWDQIKHIYAREAERAEALLAEAVEAIEYFMNGWGLDAPEYSLDPEDDELFEHEWAFDKFRATLARIQEQRNDL